MAAEISELRSMIRAHESANAAHEREMRSKVGEMAETNGTVSILKTTYEEMQERIDSLQRTVSDLEMRAKLKPALESVGRASGQLPVSQSLVVQDHVLPQRYIRIPLTDTID
jgi:chromosome segregation ATPase